MRKIIVRGRNDSRADYNNFDYLIGMDHNNLRNMAFFYTKDDRLGRGFVVVDQGSLVIADPWYWKF